MICPLDQLLLIKGDMIEVCDLAGIQSVREQRGVPTKLIGSGPEAMGFLFLSSRSLQLLRPFPTSKIATMKC